MIGQKQNLEIIKRWRINRAIPRFIIISGEKDSGRFTLANVIAEQTNAVVYVSEIGIDAVRDVIKTAYTVKQSTVYVFRDCDDMSLAAKNSLLKVVEEPPNNARFIMTVKDTANVLPTIISRATVLQMAPYTVDELGVAQNHKNIAYMIKTIADNTDERISAFLKATALCENVIIYIEKKSMLGVLKELSGIQAKADGPGIEPELFLRAFRHQIQDADINPRVIMKFVPHIVKCSNEMKRVGINKKASVETMCINIVEEYKHETEV